jgi:1,2-diacylglycerol 3-alpha-glucosyltransferase
LFYWVFQYILLGKEDSGRLVNYSLIMNIAFVSDQYWPSMSGVSVSIDSFSNELSKMGHKVFLLAPEYPDSAKCDSQWGGTNIFRFGSRRIPFDDENRLVYKREKKKVYSTLDLVKPDVIHLQTELALGKIAIRYAKKMNIPLVISAHVNWEVLMINYTPITHRGIVRWYCRYKMSNIYNEADKVIVPTLWMEVLLSLYFVRTPIHIIPTGIINSDFEKNDKSDWKSDIYKVYPQLINKKILFYAGRLGTEKNIPFLMDILKMLLSKDNNIILMIAGIGPAYNELREYSQKIGITEHVLFTGFIEHRRLKNFYTIADIFVCASKVESQGLVIIESMICGTPVVAIGKMGIREIMGGDNGGFMVDDNRETFAEKTALLLNNPEIHQIKAKEALEHAQKWTCDKYAEKLIRLYESLIIEKQSPVFSTTNPDIR